MQNKLSRSGPLRISLRPLSSTIKWNSLAPSTTFARDENYALLKEGLSYGRDTNPTYESVERVLAELETGAEALVFSSGLAAATALISSFEHGAHVVAPRIMYHGLRDWLLDFSRRWKLEVSYVDTTNLDALEQAVRPGHTRLVWIETPCNPTWGITDIAAAATIAQRAGARLACDSTVATPLLTRPIEHGADFVFHSATKYLNGHSDVIAGALVCRETGDLWDNVRFQRKFAGGVLGSFEAWLLLRGMRTMHLRVRQSCAGALRIAKHLAGHDGVERVLHPGLETHPGHDIARRQMSGGFGGVLSFLVHGGAERALQVAGRAGVFMRATSLGGVESLIEHRASVEGPNSDVAPNLLRLSVGIEAGEDLIADLDQALGVGS